MSPVNVDFKQEVTNNDASYYCNLIISIPQKVLKSYAETTRRRTPARTRKQVSVWEKQKYFNVCASMVTFMVSHQYHIFQTHNN